MFNISKRVEDLSVIAEKNLYDIYKNIDEVNYINQAKILKAFQKNKVSTAHFNSTSGYGYGDIGREVIENIYADIFNAEDALVRIQFVNGTHAISTCLYSVLRVNDEFMYITGKPYDTLHEVIGIEDNELSLKNMNIKYTEIDLDDEGNFKEKDILDYIKNNKVKLICIQRSKGYSNRKTLSVEQIGNITKKIKEIDNNIIVMVDNCYGELVQTIEPTDVNVDLCCGSLIKNLGGGICNTGAYIVGKEKYIKMCSERLTSPGIGKECGATLNQNRDILQGLFLSPNVVCSSIKAMIFASYLLEELGFLTNPKYNEKRYDIVQSVEFRDKEKLIKFIQGIQKASPIDSHVLPMPWDMPGYTDKVIMAAGTFIEGASIELSADAPIREPYTAYIQGGLTYNSAKIAIMIAISNMLED
jgi:cystathionine beta-lyase family protein involved in aluminum resistance